MNIIIQGTQLELTERLRTYVIDKMEDAFRAFGDMKLDGVQVTIALERTANHRMNEREKGHLFRAEANVALPGRMLRAEASAPAVRQAVVKLKHILNREIRHWHERVIDGSRNGARTAKTQHGKVGWNAEKEWDMAETWEEEWAEEEARLETQSDPEEQWTSWDEADEDLRDLV